MDNKRFLTPHEMGEFIVDLAKTKAENSWIRLLILGIFAGFFISFAANGSTMTAHFLLFNPDTYGLGRALTGFIFAVGLMMVQITGSELFTGNNLMIIGVMEKRITLKGMFRNWGIVYTANLIGALIMVILIVYSGILNSSSGYAGMTIRIAASKTSMNIFHAFLQGILCNMLVCTAVLMSYGARDITGKLFACFFPIWLFVTSGFEHSIANMFYIPAGILAKSNVDFLNASQISGVMAENLTWANFFLKNLIPVTIGNIIGGTLILGFFFWFANLRNNNNN